MRKTIARKKTSSPASSRRPSPEMHARQCSICRHPQREAIEHDFIAWVNAREIAAAYGLGGQANVYRHAHATALFERRRQNVVAALDRIIEHVGEVTPTGGKIVSAVALMARINANGGRGLAGRPIRSKRLTACLPTRC